ncbi:serine/threonine-protein kinase [Candidatus Uabimicrobium amorphum]|uniref:non-specific serine/threonine protein kinase n=1 Tax=Uabimicrobium amorphum TaxID=2596890 RepID=A0A5S9IND6_UABAM|nr:serine/threonine-protein kinase [Candidatus Uabimicrobium amorphum]BBM83745.1 serine/threonine protein kinase [Candidatus Uabimicrobium amorphum]
MFAENFQILHSLGSGAMGEVFAAIDTRNNKRVAIKVIRDDKEISQQILKRFDRESNLLEQLNHPNIVRVYEKGIFQNQPYFTMDLVEGTTFKTILQNRNFTLRRKLIVLKQVIEAVHYAHNYGIIHRDLKPENIMVTADDHALVMDFGVAHNQATNNTIKLTKTGMLIGTPVYMSPEQVNGEKITCASDVFTLGAIMYEIITGQTPFSGNLSKIMWQIANAPPQHPRKISPNIAKDLARICLKAMDKNISRRYLSALEMAQDIDCYLCGEKISISPYANFHHWLRQNTYTVILPFAILSVGIFFLLSNEKQTSGKTTTNDITVNTPNTENPKRPKKIKYPEGFEHWPPPPTPIDPRFGSMHKEIFVKEHYDFCQQCYDLLKDNNVDLGRPPNWPGVPTNLLNQIILHAEQEQ